LECGDYAMIETLRKIDKIEGKISRSECLILYKLAKMVTEEFDEKPVLCEIGSYQGKSTVSIAMALKESARGILYAIDWHQGSPGFPGYGQGQNQASFDKYMNNLQLFSVADRVITIKDKSENSFDKVPDQIHFLWIDGSHDYGNVKSDYVNYHKKLAKGGYLLFHDACWTTWTDPFRVISEYILDDENYNLYALMGNTVVFKKEKNRRWKIIRSVLRHLCRFVSGENRGFYKRLLSAFFLRLTSLHALYKLR
jgi:predicted O-methyltransferase YrrM